MNITTEDISLAVAFFALGFSVAMFIRGSW